MFSKHKRNHWQIAYRNNAEKEFTLVQNPDWGWCADPFLVKFQGEIYLFAEIFLYDADEGDCRETGNERGDCAINTQPDA